MSKKLKVVETAAVEVPAEVSDFAQKSVDQAQAAFDKASDLAHSNMQYFDAAAGAFKARAADIQLKTMEIAQINMNSAFTFVRKAFAVKDPTEYRGPAAGFRARSVRRFLAPGERAQRACRAACPGDGEAGAGWRAQVLR